VPITVTPTEIIYHRRVRALDHAKATGNVAETCRVFGVSRKTFYEWRNEVWMERFVSCFEVLARRLRDVPSTPPGSPPAPQRRWALHLVIDG
jgi:hypothetical protein